MRSFQAVFCIVVCTWFYTATSYADTLITEPNDGPTPLLRFIDDTQSSVDVVMYGFTDLQFENALHKALDHRKQVRLLLQHTPYRAESENQAAILALQNDHIPFVYPDGDFQLTHQKTVIRDHQQALVMTFNWTHSVFKNERNFALILSDPAMVAEIQAVFNADWQHLPIKTSHPDIVWSPYNSRKKIIAAIHNAHSSIEVYAETISDYAIIGALAEAARRRVSVSILTSTHDKTSVNKKHAFLQRAGVHLRLSEHYYIHAKVMIFDKTAAIIGSINLTKASLDKNRELAVITRDANVIKNLEETFAMDFGQMLKTPWQDTIRLQDLKKTVRQLRSIQKYFRQQPSQKKHQHHSFASRKTTHKHHHSLS